MHYSALFTESVISCRDCFTCGIDKLNYDFPDVYRQIHIKACLSASISSYIYFCITVG